MKAADVHPPGYPTVAAVESMGKKIEAATNGRIKFQMFPGSVLGAEKEMVEQTQVGAIQMLRTSLGPVGPVVPEVNVFNMPFVFRDPAHMRKVIDGPIGQEMLDKITDSPPSSWRWRWMDGGSRSLYTKKPVRKPDDLKGQKIRMMGNPLFVDTMNAMGGNGISMGYGEVFTAMQTGVIDGAENNPPTLLTANHYQAGAKYYTPDQPPDHSRDPRDVEGHLGQAHAGRPGAGEEVRPRGAARAAHAVGRLHSGQPSPSSRPRASSSSTSTTSLSSTPPRRCAPSTARRTPT